uniref:DUF148 domain-containing protein n=1 Tax=Parastrongyloides trichosuri TaxID=131310 RepID=A0A0N4Z4B8_PARTI
MKIIKILLLSIALINHLFIYCYLDNDYVDSLPAPSFEKPTKSIKTKTTTETPRKVTSQEKIKIFYKVCKDVAKNEDLSFNDIVDTFRNLGKSMNDESAESELLINEVENEVKRRKEESLNIVNSIYNPLIKKVGKEIDELLFNKELSRTKIKPKLHDIFSIIKGNNEFENYESN